MRVPIPNKLDIIGSVTCPRFTILYWWQTRFRGLFIMCALLISLARTAIFFSPSDQSHSNIFPVRFLFRIYCGICGISQSAIVIVILQLWENISYADHHWNQVFDWSDMTSVTYSSNNGSTDSWTHRIYATNKMTLPCREHCHRAGSALAESIMRQGAWQALTGQWRKRNIESGGAENGC